MKKESKKTDTIGVRFTKSILDEVIQKGYAKSPQYALNLYEKAYLKSLSQPVKDVEIKQDLPLKSYIEIEIQKIKNEPIPKERDTTFGRKIWAAEKGKRINDLMLKLKN